MPRGGAGRNGRSGKEEAGAVGVGRAGPVPQEDGRCRVWIEGVSPELDAGRYAIKRVVGERVEVEADIFADGHDVLAAVLRYRPGAAGEWQEERMTALGNDRWRAAFEVTEPGVAEYTLEAWVDAFETWRHDTEKKRKAGQEVSVELLAGAALMEAASGRAGGREGRWLKEEAAAVRGDGTGGAVEARAERAMGADLAEAMARHPDRRLATRYGRVLRVTVDPVLARFGAWYEMFPRSCPGRQGPHGTFRDVEAVLPRIADMGFQVLYLPPIHPIGRAFRKGRNNRTECEPGEPGSPWGIGGAEGGHTAIHPELGTLEDFRRLVGRARALGIELALDVAFQCSPDHPWVREHPGWFRKRPDGTIQYAENPPKKYQDIYPIDFETEDWRGLWEGLRGVFLYWLGQGVTVFRVDNPHTKALAFWEWAIGTIKAVHPEAIFLSEAFTRPKLMYALAKLGFTQSYNYFPWRNAKDELTEYFTELTSSPVREFFRPNLWPNTPDILTQYLQAGGRPAFMTRLVLAATLGASYGIYGPAFELCENRPRSAGSEEYLNSEKYEIRNWNWDAPGNLTELIRSVNRIRRENPALWANEGLRFHRTDNPQLIAYSKATASLDNILLVVVNLDPHHVQSGWLELPLDDLGIDRSGNFQVHDLLTDARYPWHGARNYIELNPQLLPAHIFRLRSHLRSERDFDTYQ
ncbi:MAG: alpha-1,4-glucan--maltose-1-phosphate maltosyltransferase [Verrucomicrobiae bacterium]|nr:alpha-1,4-glucan--maltose-1-phosphate maltosyltransferase [Verrucomicrobiae bacterium]